MRILFQRIARAHTRFRLFVGVDGAAKGVTVYRLPRPLLRATIASVVGSIWCEANLDRSLWCIRVRHPSCKRRDSVVRLLLT